MGLYQKATALDGLERFDEAIEAYLASIENDPLNADAYNDLADTYLQTDHIDEAIEMASMAIAITPDMDIGYATLAEALRKAGREADAVEVEKRAEEVHDLDHAE